MLAAGGVLWACESEPTATAPSSNAVPSLDVDAPVGSVVLVGAGDIASCGTNKDDLTANLLDGIDGQVFTVGDNAFPDGSAADFANCYEPTWGRHKARTRPAAGDRDYRTSGASGYFAYFGQSAGDPATGYYSYDLGAWHIVVLNTALSTSANSAQVQWLQADLAANPRACTMAIWHRPYVTSSTVGGRPAVKPIWDVLYQNDVRVVVNAHARVYERFAPQDPELNPDPVNGIRQFVVGTGGRGVDGFGEALPNSEVRATGVRGVIKFTLHANSYDWEFVSLPDDPFTDSGTEVCDVDIDAPPVANAGGPYAGDGVIEFDGSASSDPQGDYPLSFDWDFGDGSPHGTGESPTHVYAADGSYTATLVVTDASGITSEPITAQVVVANVAPTLEIAHTGSALPNSEAAITLHFSDAGTADAPWNYAIDWGDGSAPTLGSVVDQAPIDGTHFYADTGVYTVVATVTDKDGGVGSATIPLPVVLQSSGEFVLIGAGDIAECGNNYWNQYDEETGKLIDAYPDAVVFTAGDNADPGRDAIHYEQCYESAWGRHKDRTLVTLGNHDYDGGNADAALAYFGDRVGTNGKGFYSVDIGDWHIVVINDNESWVPVSAGSEQDLWLQADLASSTKLCTIAIWHQPLSWSHDSGARYRKARKTLWDRLYAAGAEIVINGHQHFYERFAPQDPDLNPDPLGGIRQFIVGTGGNGVVAPSIQNAPNSEVVGITKGLGVLKLTLGAGVYSWEFLPIPGVDFTDSGSGTCH